MKYTFTLFLIISSFIFSCEEKVEFFKIEGETQGTTYSIIYEGDHPDLKKDIDSLLNVFDMSMSTYEPNSTISKINKGNNIPVDSFFIEMYEKAREVHKKSNGAFDITLGPIVNVYGFGYEEVETEIDSILIDSLLQYVGMEKIKIENSFMIKDDINVKLSSNAISQGQAVDMLCNYLESAGINNYMAEIGGELRTSGLKYNNKWKVGIDKPFEGNNVPGENIQTVLHITDKALASSGNYRHFYIRKGKKYSHTIDPKTGYPAFQDIKSSTIIADDCMSADAYATACMVLGLEKSIKLVESQADLDAYFVYTDQETGETKVYYTKAVEEMIDPEYK
jgi:thiamine biosynthesis lipoprotein